MINVIYLPYKVSLRIIELSIRIFMKRGQLPKIVNIFSDGGARSNPGPAAYGFIAYDDKNNKLFCGSQYLGKTTNNQAEYRGVIGALEYINNLTENNKYEQVIQINILLDSKLIVEQMNGNYKIKSEALKPLYWQIRELVLKLNSHVNFLHINREKNEEADKLVNAELNRNIR